jgi:hypothetical protein
MMACPLQGLVRSVASPEETTAISFSAGLRNNDQGNGKTDLVQSPIDINKRSHKVANAQGKILCGNEPYCNVHGLSRSALLDPSFGTSIGLLTMSLISIDKNARLFPSGLLTRSAALTAKATVTQQNKPKSGSAIRKRWAVGE